MFILIYQKNNRIYNNNIDYFKDKNVRILYDDNYKYNAKTILKIIRVL